MLEQLHAHCCMKAAIVAALEDGENVTVSCDRDDCYDCQEVYEGKCAINVEFGPDSIGEMRKVSDPEVEKSLASPSITAYDAEIALSVEVYALQCEGSACKAATVAGWVTHRLYNNRSIPAKRIVYTGSTPSVHTSVANSSFTFIQMRFSLEYLFSPEKPWLLTGCLRG